MSSLMAQSEIDLSAHKKEIQLQEGTKVLLRPMVMEDKDALHEFFKGISNEDARFLRDDVSSILLIEKWANNLDYNKTLPILAIRGGRIVADATIDRESSGWKRHLGFVRIFVHKDFRNVGLGYRMIEELMDVAYKLGIEKLIAEVPNVNPSAINAFAKAGFGRVAVIPNMAKDRENMPLDIVFMMKDVRPAYDENYEYEF